MKKFNFLKFSLVFAIVLSPSVIFAQNFSNNFLINVSPKEPQPGQEVSARVQVSEFNVDLAKIDWKIDDEMVKSGTGEKSITFNAPPAGETKVVSATITAVGRAPMTQTISVSSSGTVDLIFEATDGYTPPFYRGKTLPIKQSFIKVVAIPLLKDSSGVLEKPKNLAYSWQKDGGNVPSQSGLGKNSLVFGNQILDGTNKISVSVTNGSKTSTSSINIPFFNPEILFYEYESSKSSAKYQKALYKTVSLDASRLTLVAEPYFLLKDWVSNSQVSLNWKVNNLSAKGSLKNILGISFPTKGQYNVEVEYNESQKLFRNIIERIAVTVK